MFDLGGKTALVTGASGGIGGAIARVCMVPAPRCCSTARGRRRSNAGRRTRRARFRRHFGSRRSGGGRRADQDRRRRMGQLDILVNNAGLTRDMLAMRLKDEDWQKVIDVDLTAGFRLARGALRGMVRRRWGRIISDHLGRRHHRQSRPGELRRGQGRAGRHVESTRRRSGATWCHGQLCRAGLYRNGNDRRAERGAKSPNRAGDTDGPGRYARRGRGRGTFVASDEARYVTGQTLHINGGLAMI